MQNILINGNILNLDKYSSYEYYKDDTPTLLLFEHGTDSPRIARGPEAEGAWEWLQKTVLWKHDEGGNE